MKTEKLLWIGVVSLLVTVNRTWACACGCEVFEVGTGAMLPTEPGGMVSLNYAFQNQNRNWHGSSDAPAADNEDKELRSHYMSVDVLYMFNRRWGAQVDLPAANRFMRADDGSSDWWAFGDMRVKAVYTGFADDMSTGLTFGLKLPTGDYKHDSSLVDRDSQIGTGSTDILLGAFHRGSLTHDNRWGWFAQTELQVPVLTTDDYTPGIEVNLATGIFYSGFTVRDVTIVPIAQVIASEKTHDSGANSADPTASGYQRIMLSPGVEFDMHSFRLYSDVEFPVFQTVTGNQLIAPVQFKVSVSYKF